MAVMFVISYNVTLSDRATPNSVDLERKNGKRKWWEVYGEKKELSKEKEEKEENKDQIEPELIRGEFRRRPGK